MKQRAGLLGVLLCFAWPAVAAQDLLVAQVRYPLVESKDPNVLLSSYVAEALDKDGRVRPVVWSLFDPVFREWTESDRFGEFEQYPDAKTVLAKAARLRVTHVLIVQARTADQAYVAVGELFVGGRLKWRFGPRSPNKKTDITISPTGQYDQKTVDQLKGRMPELLSSGGTFTVFTAGVPDWDATARALANTWCTLLAEGPLKRFDPHPRTVETPGAGTNPETAPDTGLDPRAGDVVERAMALADGGKTSQALSLLRAACDLRPNEIKLREGMARLLIRAGMPEEAARASIAATRLEPKDAGLWLLTAQAWVAAGDPDSALEALKEAQARGLDGAAADQVQADIALLSGDAARAAKYYANVKGTGPCAKRAVALACQGDLAGVDQALSELGPAELSPADYTDTVVFIEKTMPRLSKEAASILPMIRLHPGEDATLRAAKSVTDKCEALRRLVAAIKPPKQFEQSHEARKLAHILLAQSTLEANQFAQNNDSEIGEEAAATLGQALRLLPAVQEKFRLEQRYGGL